MTCDAVTSEGTSLAGLSLPALGSLLLRIACSHPAVACLPSLLLMPSRPFRCTAAVAALGALGVPTFFFFLLKKRKYGRRAEFWREPLCQVEHGTRLALAVDS